MRDRTDGHLLLLHGLKQCGLGLWRCTVDLVSEEEIAKQWTWFEREFTFLGVVDVGTGDVSREQVRRELNTLEVATQRIGEGVGHQRLGQSGVVFEQKVPVGQDVDQHVVNDVCLTDNDLLDFG